MDAEKNLYLEREVANTHMEFKAKAKHKRISPKKLRLVTDAVKGKPVTEALQALPLMKKKGSEIVFKTLKSAIANANNVEGFDFVEEDFYIKNIRVDQAPSLPRYREGAMGRAKPYKHRFSHLTVIVSDDKNNQN